MNILKINEAKRNVFRRLTWLLSIVFVLMCLYGSISGSFDMGTDINIKRVEINIKQVDSSETEKVLIKHAKELNYNLQNCVVSFISEVDCYAATKDKTYPVKAILSDDNYIKFTPVHIIKGAYFNEFACKYGMNAVVISKNLAQKIYSSHDVIGSHIEILDQKYVITGLYEDRAPLLSLLTSDGIDRIYIPFESHKQYESLPLKTLFISGEDIENDKCRDYSITTILGGNLRINSDLYKLTDFYGIFQAINQPASLLIYMVGILCILLLGSGILKYFKWVRGLYVKVLKDKYFTDAVRTNMLGIIAYLLGFIMILGSAAAIYLSIRFEPYLPVNWIPQENIFDFNFYSNRIRNFIYLSNLSEGYAHTWLDAYSSMAIKLNAILTILTILSLISAIYCIKLCVLMEVEPVILTKSLLISIPVSLAMLFIFTAVFHIRYVVPFKNFTILIVLLFLYTFSLYIKQKNNYRNKTETNAQ